MTDQSPLIDQLGRLAVLLRDCDRDELWLQVKQCHHLVAQQSQVVLSVGDQPDGNRAEGMSTRPPRMLTFQLSPDTGPVDVGQWFRVRRVGAQVRVEQCPAFC